MIWYSVLAIPLVGAAAVYFGWGFIDHLRQKRFAKELIEKEMSKIFDEAAKAKAALPDPERPLDAEAINAALNRIRAAGRKPL